MPAFLSVLQAKIFETGLSYLETGHLTYTFSFSQVTFHSPSNASHLSLHISCYSWPPHPELTRVYFWTTIHQTNQRQLMYHFEPPLIRTLLQLTYHFGPPLIRTLSMSCVKMVSSLGNWCLFCSFLLTTFFISADLYRDYLLSYPRWSSPPYNTIDHVQ